MKKMIRMYVSYIRQGFKNFHRIESSGSQSSLSIHFFFLFRICNLLRDLFFSSVFDAGFECDQFVIESFLVFRISDLNPKEKYYVKMLGFCDLTNFFKVDKIVHLLAEE